ncbi:hypothetical protein [Pseudomonas fluorescens]|uniref:Uncharacterized protein n=1 Tax=Pseudomonas fluorescens TaxID=294 RepID=A0A5E7FFI3_PSEFL|nr:hypothetical protein [Pseudomonas fluorescens]VVO37654.1 hypothetical protein PS723_05513 [Pseudomonas fluorescens]
MSLATTIFMLICGWLAVAAAMLWGVLRITRRHHHPHQPAAPGKNAKPDRRAAGVH